MLKRIPISFILIIFIYQFCCYLKFRNQIIPDVDYEIEIENSITEDNKNLNKNENIINQDENNQNNMNQNNMNNNNMNQDNINPDNNLNQKEKIKFNYDNNHSSTNIFKDFYYGEPHKTIMSKNGPVYLWQFNTPNPWTKIIYIPGNEFNYEFSFSTQVPA